MTKKFLYLFTLLALYSISVCSQSLTETEIVGTWSVNKVNVLDSNVVKEQKDKFTLLKKAFLNSKFVFKADKKFSFDFSYEELRIRDGYWRQDKSTKNFIIQDVKGRDTNKYILMEISAIKEEKKILFLISEVFFELEMKKN